MEPTLNYILATDGLSGNLNKLQKEVGVKHRVVHIIRHMKDSKDVVSKVEEYIRHLDSNIIPIVIVSAGSRDVSVDHLGLSHISNSIIRDSNNNLTTYAVDYLKDIFENLKSLVSSRGGKIVFSFLVPCPKEQMYGVSSNSLKIQKALSEIFVNCNDMIDALNDGPTPDIKQFVEVKGRRSCMPARRQKKIRNINYTDGVQPVRKVQVEMLKVLCRYMDILKSMLHE